MIMMKTGEIVGREKQAPPLSTIMNQRSLKIARRTKRSPFPKRAALKSMQIK
jgi:ABC-type Fe3+-hydroxamate transport system substrate-binding protein